MEADLDFVNGDELDIKRRFNPASPWKNYRRLNKDKAAEFLSIEDIYNLSEKFTSLRDKCLFVLAYITAGRIEELVRRKALKFSKKKVRMLKKGRTKITQVTDYSKKSIIKEELGIDKSRITIHNNNGRELLVIAMRNLKNKIEHIKIIPFPLDNETNKKLNRIVQAYLSGLYPEEELFPFGKRRAEQIISSAIGFNPHFLRTCRLTHLVRYYNFSDQKLKTYAGWSDSRPSKNYIKINWEDLANSMYSPDENNLSSK